MTRPSRSAKTPSTHATLLARLRTDTDAEAWTTFVDLYTPLVYRFCRGRNLQDADARDITQQVLETFGLRLITKLKSNMKNRLMLVEDKLLLRKRATSSSLRASVVRASTSPAATRASMGAQRVQVARRRFSDLL